MKKMVLLVGPPGSGKSSAREVLEEMGYKSFVMGDLLRKRFGGNAKIKRDMSRGKLLSENIVFRVFRKCFFKRSRRVVLDGVVRSLDMLNRVLKFVALRKYSHCMLVIVGDEKVFRHRVVFRRGCPKCLRVYNLKTDPPKKKDRCDDDGVLLKQRKDDTLKVYAERMKYYRMKTVPVIEEYKSRGYKVIEVDGGLPLDRFKRRVKKLI
jgi:adenylate kinase